MRLQWGLRFLLLLLCVALASQFAAAQQAPTLFPQPLSPRIANYNIDVRLGPDSKRLDGRQVLVWHNKSQNAIGELQFHLYLNGFRNTESTFMKDSNGRHRGHQVSDAGWGYIDVRSLKLAYGSRAATQGVLWPEAADSMMQAAFDLTSEIAFIQPDDGNEQDRSVFAVPLPRPLPPGDSLVVRIDFDAKLPEPAIARTGGKKEYVFAGQWFPKIGVYTKQGWNTHQFHSESEFFADFGVYNVRITVPEDYIVGATGIEVEVTDNPNGGATHFYHAEDVHDFAWTASPEFLVFNQRADDVDIRLMLQPDHLGQAERHLGAARYAIETFQSWYGDYPFPNLTIVDPRRGAGATGGMEYPTLITTGTHYGSPKGIKLVEHVIIHEFGHNYWYHMLASNEFEESWLDEGINTYTDIQIAGRPDGPVRYFMDFLGVKLDFIQMNRASVILAGDRDPIMRKAWEFYSAGSYGVNSYAKAGLVLTTLQNYLGAELMRKVMRTYVERWRFKHPTSEDFFAIVNEVAGQNLDWFFQQAFYTRAELDYSVTHVFTRPTRPPRGFDYTMSTASSDSALSLLDTTNSAAVAGESAALQATDGATDTSAAESTDIAEQEQPTLYYSGVNVRRLGAVQFPVEIEVVFEDGEVIRETWDGKALWKKFRYTKDAQLVSATVDPERKIPLDLNFTNNSKTIENQSLGINKLSARWLFWMQFLLDQPDFLNLAAAGLELMQP